MTPSDSSKMERLHLTALDAAFRGVLALLTAKGILSEQELAALVECAVDKMGEREKDDIRTLLNEIMRAPALSPRIRR